MPDDPVSDSGYQRQRRQRRLRGAQRVDEFRNRLAVAKGLSVDLSYVPVVFGRLVPHHQFNTAGLKYVA
jgi:hypothetical protein